MRVDVRSTIPTARTFHRAVVLENKMFILGGFDGRRQNDMHCIKLAPDGSGGGGSQQALLAPTASVGANAGDARSSALQRELSLRGGENSQVVREASFASGRNSVGGAAPGSPVRGASSTGANGGMEQAGGSSPSNRPSGAFAGVGDASADAAALLPEDFYIWQEVKEQKGRLFVELRRYF